MKRTIFYTHKKAVGRNRREGGRGPWIIGTPRDYFTNPSKYGIYNGNYVEWREEKQ